VLIQEVPLGLIGYGARTGTFLGIGLIVGLQSQRRLKLEADRGRLIAERHRRQCATGSPGGPIAGRGTTASNRSRARLSVWTTGSAFGA
jgi:hypothetical protein